MYLGIFSKLVGQSEALNELVLSLDKLADKSAPLIILGEAATGKESLAYEVHLQELSEENPFVSFNPSFYMAGVLEAELFGYERGAFPGALSTKLGALAQADGGTLFIDNFEYLSLDIQQEIFDVIQFKSANPLGSLVSTPTEFNLMIGVSDSLEDALLEGRLLPEIVELFDQYLVMPSLAQRREDIPALLQVVFTEQVSDFEQLPQLDDEALEVVQNYSWPGNVLELEAFAQSLIAEFSGKKVRIADLPARYSDAQPANQMDLGLKKGGLDQLLNFSDSGFDDEDVANFDLNSQVFLPVYDFSMSLKEFMEVAEVTLIETALARTEGNVTKAAQMLQTKRTTLIEKMRKFKIESR